MCLLAPSLTQKWSSHPCGDGTVNISGILILEIEETHCKVSGDNELSPGPWPPYGNKGQIPRQVPVMSLPGTVTEGDHP